MPETTEGPYADQASPYYSPYVTAGSPQRLRDAAVDPRPGDFIPKRAVDGHPDVLKHAVVGEPEYYAAVAERRAGAL